MRVLLLVNATLNDATERAIAEGRCPRKDYIELQSALAADIIDLGAFDRRVWTRVARRLVGAGVAQALLAWAVSGRYDAVFADRETTGFLLAALSKLRRRRPRLVMIGHLLSAPKKQMLFRALCLRESVDCIIVHSSLQQRIAEHSLRLQPDQVALVPYQCDERFWAPCGSAMKRQLCSVGLEYRDYDTLVGAVEGLDVDVVIAAASLWSKHSATVQTPPRVQVAAFDYQSLRQLYAESLFVVVPLHDVENQAGITVILEAMAMGKALVVSHTRGQADVVRDRRRINRSDPDRVSQPDWVRRLGAGDSIAEGQTGIYVMPGDTVELRRAIVFLLEHPEQARRMGENGRRVIEATMSLDHFIERLAAVIRGERVISRESDTHTAGIDVSSSHTV